MNLDELFEKLEPNKLKEQYFYMDSSTFWILVGCLVMIVIYALVARKLYGV
jgi:hypothetical protein